MLRILTSLVLAALVLLAVFFLSDRWILFLALGAAELAAVELVRIGRTWAPDAPLRLLFLLLPPLTLLLALGLTPGSGGVPLQAVILLIALLLGPVVAAILLLARTPAAQALPALGCVSFGGVYIALPVVSCWRLQQMDPWLLVLLLMVVAIGDTAAYYFGKTFGRRKMSPLISPNKTWVGAGAGFLGAIVATVSWSWWHFGRVDAEWLVLGAAAGVAAQCGDLVESMLKRGAGIKDSGRLLPGHGGILDRTDGLLFAAPVLLLGLILMVG